MFPTTEFLWVFASCDIGMKYVPRRKTLYLGKEKKDRRIKMQKREE